MTDLAQKEEQLLALVRQHDSLGPKQAAVALGWTKEQVAQAKEGLKAKGLISTGKGGGMQVAGLAFAKPSAEQGGQPASAKASAGTKAHKPAAGNLRTAGPIQPVTKDLEATGPKANRPTGQEAPSPMANEPLAVYPREAQADPARPIGHRPMAKRPLSLQAEGLKAQ